jgi:hypothetical protein
MDTFSNTPANPNIPATPTPTPETTGESTRTGVSPVVAAAFLAGVVYMWGEAVFRLAFTFNANFDAFWVLWQGRVGDIAAMWLTISGVALVVFFVFGYLFFRGRQALGSITFWTILLIASAIIAPLIGEIGTPIGI